jgi:hypothetical protein
MPELSNELGRGPGKEVLQFGGPWSRSESQCARYLEHSPAKRALVELLTKALCYVRAQFDESSAVRQNVGNFGFEAILLEAKCEVSMLFKMILEELLLIRKAKRVKSESPKWPVMWA